MKLVYDNLQRYPSELNDETQKEPVKIQYWHNPI